GTALAGSVAFTVVNGHQNAPAPPPAKAKPENRPTLTDLHGDALPAGAVARLGTVRFNHGDGLDALFYTRDRKTIVSKGGGCVRVWDAETGKELSQFANGKPGWNEIALLLADDRSLLLLSQEPSETVRTFDVTLGKETRRVWLPIQRHEWSVERRNAISPDG